MSTAVHRSDEGARRGISAHGRTFVREHELLRHPVYTRVLHWTVAIFFIAALLSGFAIYSPWLFHLIAPALGGGPTVRLLHPWFSLAFIAAFCLQILNWLEPMKWKSEDRHLMRRLRDYVANTDEVEPEYVDFFNAGQKLYFWAIVASALVFLVSGVPMWFPKTFGATVVDIAYVLHDIAALLMLGGFILHVYEATAGQSGTFHSMTRGTVERRWAWTHHPAWYRRATGRDPVTDRQAAEAALGRGPSSNQ